MRMNKTEEQSVYVTVRKKDGPSKTITVYGTTLEQVMDLIQESIQRAAKKSAKSSVTAA